MALAASFMLAACGGPNTYTSGPISFQYPHGWRTVLPPASTPGGAGRTTRVGVGIDPNDVVVLVTTDLSGVTSAQDIQSTEQSVVQSLADGAKNRGASVQGPFADKIGGFDGLGLAITGLQISGSTLVSRVVVVVRGGVEYLLNCLATPGHADEVGKGCAQVISTFSLS